MATINGTTNADSLTGTVDGDSIYGLAGNDTLSGLAGTDYLWGSEGNDSLSGGDGGDSLYGESGADRLQGDAGDDYFYLYSGEGPDTIDGGTGNDILYAYYYGATTGQIVDLATGSTSDGSSWQNIERLSFTGSNTGADSARGGADADSLYGRGGNDTLLGLAGVDYLYGGDGNDSLSGGDDGDSLYGEAGADRLDGGAGDDYLYVYAAEAPDTIDGGTGSDYLYLNYTGVTAGQVVALASGNASDGSSWQNIERFTFYGSEVGGDSASGGAGSDGLYGGGGNDTLVGLGGTDYLYGEEGDDILSGGDDADSLQGGFGADRLEGGAGDDYFYVYGNEGPDTIIGGAGNDYLYLYYSAQIAGLTIDFTSGTANDGIEWQGIERFAFYGSATAADSVIGDAGSAYLYLYGNGGADTLSGGSAADYLYGEADADRLAGGGGNDLLDGGDGADTLNGGDGADYLYGRAGADLLAGDAGNDSFIVYLGTEAGADTLDGGAGTDYANFYDRASTDFDIDTQADGSILLTDVNLGNGDDGVLTLRSIEWATFSDRSIQLGTDNSGDEDYDLSGPGGGTVAGGDGDDTYIVDDPNDTPVESAGGGIDTVRASISWVLGQNLDNLVLIGTGDLSGTGNVLPNEITGTSGRNSLDGGAGADTLRGGAGGDTYYIDDPLDQVIETATSAAQRGTVAALARAERLLDAIDDRPSDAAQDADTIVASLGRAVLSAFVESGVLAEGSAAREVIGNVLDNTAQGNSAGNLLQGGAGNDTLNGGDGIDVAAYTGSRAGYTVTVNAATITVTDNNASDGNEGVDTLSSIEALRFADQVFEIGNLTVSDGTATGDAMDLGTAGAQAGAGGTGDDTYTVNAAGDAVVERPNEGSDTVRSGVNWTLWENIEHLVLTGTAVQGVGNAENNAITGNDAANGLLGYAGNDTLNGGAGADTLRGGAGNDVYLMGAGDKIEEQPGEGTDTVQSAATSALPANFERLVLTGSAAVNGFGNTASNALTGNSAVNRLEGGEGNDTLNGAAGNDSLIGGSGNDTYVVTSGDKLTEQAGGGTDTVQSAVTWTLAANIEKLTLTGSKGVNGTGSSGANTLTGNGGANVLKGSGGNDMLVGGGGNDVLAGGAGSDRLTGGPGADAFLFDMALNATTNKDTIADFAIGSDKLRLDDDIFSAFDAGISTTLASGAFRSGAGTTAATDADDRILYNTTTGALYYDADGTGAAAAVQFAVLGAGTHPALGAGDFVIAG